MMDEASFGFLWSAQLRISRPHAHRLAG